VNVDYLATGVHRAQAGKGVVEARVASRFGDLEAGRKLLDAAAKDAETDDDRLQTEVAFGELAYRSGNVDEAIERLQAAIDAGAREAVAVDLLSRAYAKSGRLEDAIALLERARASAEQEDRSSDLLRFSVLLANALIDLGSFGRAAEVLGGSLAQSDEWREPLSRAGLYWSQSRLHAINHKPDLAAWYAQKALVLLELSDESGYVGRLYQLLAFIELERNDPHAALEMLSRGRDAMGRSATGEDEAKFALEEARAFARLDQTDEARQRAMETLARMDKLDPQDAARAYAALADVFVRVGDSARAAELYELAIEQMEQHGHPYLTETCSAYAQLLKQQGRAEDALAVLERAVNFRIASRARSF